MHRERDFLSDHEDLIRRTELQANCQGPRLPRAHTPTIHTCKRGEHSDVGVHAQHTIEESTGLLERLPSSSGEVAPVPFPAARLAALLICERSSWRRWVTCRSPPPPPPRLLVGLVPPLPVRLELPLEFEPQLTMPAKKTAPRRSLPRRPNSASKSHSA